MTKQSLTTKVIVATHDDEPKLDVTLRCSCHVFRGYETIVDGHVIDDGIDVECDVKAALMDHDEPILEVYGCSTEIPECFAKSWLRPKAIPVNSARDAERVQSVDSDIAEDLRDMVDNPLDYVDHECELEDELAAAIRERLEELATESLGICVEWEA